jgi:hypothetical protein
MGSALIAVAVALLFESGESENGFYLWKKKILTFNFGLGEKQF